MVTIRVYLSLGSNLGDREANLSGALQLLGNSLQVKDVSSLYETEPVGVADQPAFLNIAVSADTELDPESLLQTAKQVETTVGRRPSFRWGPRAIDIDILLYGDRVIKSDRLTVPHAEMTNRAFVLVPLSEIASTTVHPVLTRTIAQLRDSVPGHETVRRIGPFKEPKRASREGSPSL